VGFGCSPIDDQRRAAFVRDRAADGSALKCLAVVEDFRRDDI
jgi:hypothetical protein